METKAILRGVRLSAQKGRLVADQIRGLPVGKALDVLGFSPKKGAKIIKRVLEAASANVVQQPRQTRPLRAAWEDGRAVNGLAAEILVAPLADWTIAFENQAH